MGGCNPHHTKQVTTNVYCSVGAGETHAHTKQTTPDRRRTTAGRTDQTKQERRSDGRAETGTQRQPTGADEPRNANQTEPRPAGQRAGRGKRTKQKPRTASQTPQSGARTTASKARNRPPPDETQRQSRPTKTQKHNKENTPKKIYLPQARPPQGVETGWGKLCSFLMFVNAGVSTPSEASQAKKLAFLQG